MLNETKNNHPQRSGARSACRPTNTPLFGASERGGERQVPLHVRTIRHEEQGRIYLRPHLRVRVQGRKD